MPFAYKVFTDGFRAALGKLHIGVSLWYDVIGVAFDVGVQTGV